MDITKFSCYDYAKQSWITGADAVTMRIKQLNEDLELFEGSRGAEYAKFVNVNLKQAVKNIVAELEELGNLRFRAGLGESGLSYR